MNTDRIGRITVDGTITEFPLPDRTRSSQVGLVAAGSPSGVPTAPAGSPGPGDISTFPMPTANSDPPGITGTPDGARWVALEIGSLVRLMP